MRENFKKLTIWTVVLSFFIIIGAGHGVACLGLLEIAGLLHTFNIGSVDFSFSLSVSYEKSLSVAALFALIGHLLLIVSMASKSYKIMFWTKVVGLFKLWLSFYYLAHMIFHNDLAQIGFLTGLPFLIASILLAYKLIRQALKSASV